MTTTRLTTLTPTDTNRSAHMETDNNNTDTNPTNDNSNYFNDNNNPNLNRLAQSSSPVDDSPHPAHPRNNDTRMVPDNHNARNTRQVPDNQNRRTTRQVPDNHNRRTTANNNIPTRRHNDNEHNIPEHNNASPNANDHQPATPTDNTTTPRTNHSLYRHHLYTSLNATAPTRRSRNRHRLPTTQPPPRQPRTPRRQPRSAPPANNYCANRLAHWGPPLSLPRPKHTERIVLANVDGLPQNPTMRIETFRQLADLQGTIYGITETHIDSARQFDATIPPLKATLDHIWPHNKPVYADSNDPKQPITSLRKFGGVLQFTTGASTSRIRQHDKDKIYGRWVSQTMIMADGKRCKIYTCYRVCATTPTASGPTTAYRQQWNIGVQTDVDFEPRRQFLDDFITELQHQRSDGYELLVMGDFNTEIFHNDMARLMDQCDLIDLHEPFMDPRNTSTPNTHIRGSHKIDHIFGTDFFLNAMRQGGMILSYERNIADHRILVLDLCQSKLNAINSDLTRPSQRRLNSKSPRKLEKYLDCLHQLMTDTKIEERFYGLCARTSQPGHQLTHSEELKFCRTDQQMTELMRHAEKQCGKKQYGYHSSPALSQAGRKVTSLTKRSRTVVATELIVAGTPAEKQLARSRLDAINIEIQAARSQLHATQRNSKELRKLHMADQAKVAALERNTDVEKIILEMMNHEKSNRSWTKIERYVGKKSGGQIDRILLPDENMREVSDPDEMHDILIDHSIADMNIPEGSPFTTAPMDAVIPPWDPSPLTEEILNGTYTPPSTSTPEIKELFQQLTAHQNIDPPSPDILNIEITKEQFRDAIRIRRERTASSPSGRHLGHYKAALHSDRLLTFHTAIINFARRHNCPPPRWLLFLQLRLEKIIGVPRVDKLRMIQLAEFDMNAQFGITIGREMLWHIEDNDLFHNIPQDGGRSNRTSRTCAVRKRCTVDYMRIMKRNGAMIVTDLCKCYDTIHPGLATMCAQRNGVPKQITDLKLNVLKNMSFVLRSAYGIATTSFGNGTGTAICPSHRRSNIYGCGQGAQDSGALWISMWAVMYSVMNNVRPGAKLYSADRTTKSERKGEAIIDDLDLWVMDTTLDNDDITTVTQGATELYQKWNDSARLGGARLNQSKGTWYLFYWIWENGYARLASIDESPSQLIVNHEGQTSIIQRVEPNIGTRVVGVRLEPCCNENSEFDFRLKEVKEFTTAYNTAPLNRLEAKMAHEAILLAKLRYPLAVTTFDTKRCTQLQKVFERTVIKKRGFDRSMARVIRYGPPEYGGLGFQHISDTQGCEKILILLEHFRALDDTGIDLIILLSVQQLEAGLCQPILSSHYRNPSKYITRTWLSVAWEYLSTHGLRLVVPGAWTPQPQRENDVAIMAVAIRLFGQGRKAKDLRVIQQCRLYLRVTMLSEITDATGRYLCNNIINGHRHTDRSTLLFYPKSPVPPPPSFWTAWRRFLKQLVPTESASNRSLREPLRPNYRMGAWYTPRLERWHTLYSPTTKRIYLHLSQAIQSYPQLPSRTLKFNRNSSRVEQAFPPDAIPITVTNIPTLTTTGLSATTTDPITDQHSIPTSPNTPQQIQSLDAFSQCPHLPDSLYDSIADGPDWHRAYMQYLEVCADFEAKFTLAYSRGSLRSGSDGAAPHHGSFAWKLVDSLANNFTLAQGGGNCCHFPGLTSHRMEASGRLGTDLFLAHVLATFHLPAYDGTIFHICDNLRGRQPQQCRPPTTHYEIRYPRHGYSHGN